jgi:hypothetical protein
MKIEVKVLEGKRWKGVPAEALIGESIASYMKKATSPVIAAMFQDNKPVLFISNDEKQVEAYSKKAIAFSIDDLIDMLGTTIYSPVIITAIEVFKDAQPRFTVMTKEKPCPSIIEGTQDSLELEKT